MAVTPHAIPGQRLEQDNDDFTFPTPPPPLTGARAKNGRRAFHPPCTSASSSPPVCLTYYCPIRLSFSDADCAASPWRAGVVHVPSGRRLTGACSPALNIMKPAGLGGARDATNVIQSTELAASVITTIGREHLAAVGGSLQSIAVAKSGIIKQGRPVVLGGPFSADIELVFQDRAFLTQSPVIFACDPGIKSITKCIGWDNGRPYQSCDMNINILNDMPLFLELRDVKLQQLGDHQRQNAVTASCTALCLRNLGWDISEASIQAGLEETQLPGRSQFFTQEEASVLGLNGSSTILIDGAHTEASAKALSDVIQTVKPDGPLALVIGMANDKEHLAFAEQLLSGQRPDIVLLTEVSIAGGSSRAMPASSLKEIWIAAAQDQGIDYADIGTISGIETPECINNVVGSSSGSGKRMLIGCQGAPFSCDLIKVASQLLESRSADGAAPGLICVTGSLHMVASVLQQLYKH